MAQLAGKTAPQGATGSALVSALYESRSDLPEYKRWQNAMRPEDNGYADGLVGIPAGNDQSAPFESTVRDQLNSRLGVVRNRFANDDAQMLSEILTLKTDFSYFERLSSEKRAALGRPVIVSLDRRLGPLLIAIATVLAATLLGVLWLDRGLQPFPAVLIALFSAIVGAMLAYPSGLVLRQSTETGKRWFAGTILLLVAASTTIICANMAAPSFDIVERTTIGLFAAFALLSVAASAYMMNDKDAAYKAIEMRYAGLRNRLAQLEVARIENLEFHTNVARRHVQLASQMISGYRAANISARKPGETRPALFDVPPALPQIDNDWLSFLEVPQK